MASQEATMHLVPSDPTTGIWCHWCLLPSAVQVKLHTVTSQGVTPAGTVTYCPDCGEYDRG